MNKPFYEYSCELVKNYIKEMTKENIRLLFENGGTLELATKVFQDFTPEELEQLKNDADNQI